MARLCRALGDLRAEIDAAWPNRDRGSDGWIADAAHASRVSDHNPNEHSVVRAIDVDVDGVPMVRLVEHYRAKGAAGDPRLRGGYVIFNWRIAGTHTGWEWREYTGSNGHTTHAHFSAGDAPSDYDRVGSWGISSLKGHSHGMPVLYKGCPAGGPVKDCQQHLNYWRAAYRMSRISDSGVYSDQTRYAVGSFQRFYGMPVDGKVGPQTWAKLHGVTRGQRA